MSYNKNYNNRSGRYDTQNQYVPTAATEAVDGYTPTKPKYTPTPLTQRRPQQQQQQKQQQQKPQQQQQQQKPAQAPSNHNENQQSIQTNDVEMKPVEESQTSGANSGQATPRPFWKTRLQGVKKISNKERRRRQNKNLRRLLTPKNALMVLNEMMPNEQLFKVEPAGDTQYYNQKLSFRADLTVQGNTYEGFGDSKMSARNVAAEQAIRDVIIQKMNKVLGVEENMSDGGEEGEDETLPMIQLASFALHKLFSEWEYEGHKVPQLKSKSNSVSEATPGVKTPAPKKKVHELPANASSIHPCMLLTYMRPQVGYSDLAVDGDGQNMVFTIGVEVDGSTYIGKASNKKEARKLAAKTACTAVWGVSFVDNPTETGPVKAAA